MIENISEIKKLLEAYPACNLNYDDWIAVGMALKNDGYDFSVWDEYSSRDTREGQYNPEEMKSKWDGFQTGTGCYGIGTIIKRANYYPAGKSAPKKNSKASTEQLNRKGQLIRQLKALFNPDDPVIIEKSVKKKGEPDKYVPGGPKFQTCHTQKEWLENEDALYQLTDFMEDGGVYLVANPCTPTRKDANVTAYRNILIEDDETPLSHQHEILEKLKLPIASLTYSGNKSLHAVVAVNASSPEEYKSRFLKIAGACEKFGLVVDRANKNPSRLTRLAGANRGDSKQKGMEPPEGFNTYEEWEQAWDNGEILSTEEQEKTIPEQEEIDFFTADQFKPKPVSWLIPGLIPYGRTTLLGAAGGTGKSTLICDIVASMIKGFSTCALEWGRDSTPRPPKKVLFFSSEDAFEEVTLPRLRALGCTDTDLSRLGVIPNTDESFPKIKYNSPELFGLIDKFKPELIVFDPVQAFLPDSVDMAKRNQVRGVMNELMAHLGGKTAVLIACHCNKNQKATGVDRISDSKDFPDYAGSVLMMGFTGEKENCDGDEIRYIAHEKSSYGKKMDTLLYTVESRETETGGMGFFKPIDRTTNDDSFYQLKRWQSKAPKQSKQDLCKEIIMNILDDGPRERQELKTMVTSQAKRQGVSVSDQTIFGAINTLLNESSIENKTTGFGGEKKTKYWLL